MLQCSATAPIRAVSVWASVRTSARSLGTKLNTGLFLFSLGKFSWALCKGPPKKMSALSQRGETKEKNEHKSL